MEIAKQGHPVAQGFAEINADDTESAEIRANALQLMRAARRASIGGPLGRLLRRG